MSISWTWGTPGWSVWPLHKTLLIPQGLAIWETQSHQRWAIKELKKNEVSSTGNRGIAFIFKKAYA